MQKITVKHLCEIPNLVRVTLVSLVFFKYLYL